MSGVDTSPKVYYDMTVMNTYDEDDYYRIKMNLIQTFGSLNRDLYEYADLRKRHIIPQRWFYGICIAGYSFPKQAKFVMEVVPGPWSYKGELFPGPHSRREEYLGQVGTSRSLSKTFRSIDVGLLVDPDTSLVILNTTDMDAVKFRIKLAMPEYFILECSHEST